MTIKKAKPILWCREVFGEDAFVDGDGNLLSNGAHIKPKVVQHIDFYGNGTTYNVQTVRTDEGVTVFIAQQNSQRAVRYILPPAVLAMIDRQRASLTKQIRRRNGQRIAEERAASGLKPGFMK